MAHRIWDIVLFLAGVAFSIAIFCLTADYVIDYTKKSFDAGKKLAADYTAERPSRDVEIVIEDGATIDEVADILYKEGVITSPILYKVENILKKTNDDFDGGTFTVNTSMDSNEINNTLRNKFALANDIRVTIKEGVTVREIAELLESEGFFPAQEFLDACDEIDFQYPFLEELPDRPNRLEGYLFPDTYMFAEGSSPETIIAKLLNRFDEIYKWDYRERARELGLSDDEVITMASIIEKEISRGDERKLCSAVIYNRLDIEMNLQMCSSILYVLDKRKDRLLDEDLEVESPYNTYINAGLPVGPISNPGEACIEAALYPDDVNYLYFVVKDEQTGEHVFTDNYNEFLNAKEIYKQKY